MSDVGVQHEGNGQCYGLLQAKLRFLQSNTFLDVVFVPFYALRPPTALMPGGDHLNIIDPPGLTVMRIAGGRYRVTAAHRVIWTWMNEFAPLADHRSGNKQNAVNQLQVGDLVSMTIVDVFETDNQGKLLSYCPTFDNRAVHKTHATAETLRRGGSQIMSLLGRAQKSKTAEIILRNARSVAKSVKQKVDEAVHNYQSPHRSGAPNNQQDTKTTSLSHIPGERLSVASSNYVADDDMERHEV